MAVKNWYLQSEDELFLTLASSRQGLTLHEVDRRRVQYGSNALPEPPVDSNLMIFLRQFKSPLIYVLLVACLTVWLLGETADATIILVVLAVNSIVGTLQESKAQRSLQALRRLSQTTTTVIRGGVRLTVEDTELVPGDIVELREGEKIPADARIIEAHNLTVNEAALTGEVVPTHKMVVLENPAETISLADQHNMAFKGTYVATGTALILIVAIGPETVLGKIAQSVEQIDTDIPLRGAIELLTKQVIWAVAGVSVLLFVIGLLTNHSPNEMFRIVVSLGVSAIPEGLPVVMTLILATGVMRMSRRNALVKKLEAVEALGQATVIAVDKTGTITLNQLMVTSLYLDGKSYTVTGQGYQSKGTIKLGNKLLKKMPPELLRAATIVSLNATAHLSYDEAEKTWQVAGDPTEAAFQVFAHKVGVTKEALLEKGAITHDAPFDYDKKFRATIYEKLLSVTGAPETILAMSKLTAAEREAYQKQISLLSSQGQRVIAFAYKEKVVKPDLDKLSTLTFGGLIAMQDMLHPEVRAAVAKVRKALIHVVMITGDHEQTAQAIAEQAGIFRKGDKVVSGSIIETLSIQQLAAHLTKVSVFARVNPDHKEKIIQAYRLRGDIVAMTGDGVNDAPSLVAADLGVAMGRAGTEVAKEAADIVLLDDNFTSIVAAIEEGRSIYKTIQKVIVYLFATGVGEIMVIVGALLLGLPLPITPAQIIWLNLVTDGFLTIALAMEPKEHNLLTETWGKEQRLLVDKTSLIRMVLVGAVMMVGTLLVVQLFNGSSPIKVSAVAVTVMAIFQWFNAWNSQSSTRSVFSFSLFRNPALIVATAFVVLLQLAALDIPILQSILKTEPLSIREWLLLTVIGFSIVLIEEIRKLVVRVRQTS